MAKIDLRRQVNAKITQSSPNQVSVVPLSKVSGLLRYNNLISNLVYNMPKLGIFVRMIRALYKDKRYFGDKMSGNLHDFIFLINFNWNGNSKADHLKLSDIISNSYEILDRNSSKVIDKSEIIDRIFDAVKGTKGILFLYPKLRKSKSGSGNKVKISLDEIPEWLVPKPIHKEYHPDPESSYEFLYLDLGDFDGKAEVNNFSDFPRNEKISVGIKSNNLNKDKATYMVDTLESYSF